MRDYQKELNSRVEFIRRILAESGATGIVYGNSGGKDSALVGILCKKACDNTLGILLPCSKRNFDIDLRDGQMVAQKYGIETRMLDICGLKQQVEDLVKSAGTLSAMASANIAPRLRMLVLYSVAASENRLVAGTGNRSEGYMGYFTKWGDAACDFNPIGDLTVREIYEFLRFLDCPSEILEKAPSAALFDGQTDESEMGISYEKIDDYLLSGTASPEDQALIERFHRNTEHKRKSPPVYGASL